MDEYRDFTRVKTSFAASLSVAGKSAMQVSTVDISMHGVLVECDFDIATGEHCRLHIPLGSNNESGITASCKIVRNEPGKLVLEFVDIDMDSYQHLQKMVQYNADNPDAIRQELNSRPGIKPQH